MNLQKSSLFFICVLLLVLIVVVGSIFLTIHVFIFVSPIEINKEKEIPVYISLILTDNDNNPYAVFAGVFSPAHNRAALVSIPPNMGLWTTETSPLLSVSALYKKGGKRLVEKAIEETTRLPLTYKLLIKDNDLSDILNALGGINLFYEKDVIIRWKENTPPLTLKAGGYFAEGQHAINYIHNYVESSNPRGQLYRAEDVLLNLFIAFIKEPVRRKAFLSDDLKRSISSRVKGNIRFADFKALSSFVQNMDEDSFFIETMSGSPDENNILVPIFDGRYIIKRLREIEKTVTLRRQHNKVLRSDVRLSVLNATDISGWADRVKIRMIYRGYDSREYGNFGTYLDYSCVLVRSGLPATGFIVGNHPSVNIKKIYAKTERSFLIDSILIIGYDYNELPN